MDNNPDPTGIKMTQQAPNQLPRITPDRKVIAWAYVLRCVEKNGQDERTRDAKLLVNQQLRDATDSVGAHP